ncbi:hypothetical protein [Flavobacterium frigoris]|uniref:Uncharacterized protein n=1 Tax=Flavobacterium frigoris TaxID=229204 RepID=A0A1H9RMK0_FLAFI|nr:hypothetical protein [Flavobacterium frigoris]SER73323.1 hypothetical protein SAMN05444355_1229 [Flavobacterium frigoris]
MTTISNMRIALFLLSISLVSCKNRSELVKVPDQSASAVTKKIEPLAIDQYQQRVIGTDENGDNVRGYINIEGEIGLGTLVRKDMKEIEIVVERVGKQKLIATDLEGYKYNLKIK